MRNLEGMLGTDIFYKLGLETTAAARPGEIAFTTVTGFMIAPDVRPGLWFLVATEMAEFLKALEAPVS